mmetsp:Transcript_32778/g.52760  ORF Transcript_32778/g.52760 Transcript_32778/m.52760 type:complete len:282 (+) Transcript_32778:1033-1878(+)
MMAGVGKVTAVLNILFSLSVLVLSDTSFADGGALWASVIVSALNVVIAILIEKEKLKFMTSFFKDLNENRMNKFEIALGLVKLLEDFLDEDVTYNFVQHLYGDARVRPQVLDDFEESEKRNPGWYDKTFSTCDPEFEEDELRVSNGKSRNLFCLGDIQDPYRKTIFPFYPILPTKLVEKYGHDGRFEWAGELNTVPPPALHSGKSSMQLMTPMSSLPGPAVGVMMSQSQTPSVFGMTGTVTTQGQAAFAPQPVNAFAVPPQAPAFNHYSTGPTRSRLIRDV